MLATQILSPGGKVNSQLWPRFLLCSPSGADYCARMKSAYELAMERLNKVTPTVKLTAAQKKQLA